MRLRTVGCSDPKSDQFEEGLVVFGPINTFYNTVDTQYKKDYNKLIFYN